MVDSTNPFRKAGIALIVIGVIDIGFMVYCIVNSMNYSSSLNIFAVVAGILLLKGGVKTARVVRWFSAFMFAAFVGVILFTPVFTPIGLLAAKLRIDTFQTIGAALFALFSITVIIWIHLQLSTSESLQLLKQAGYNTGKPKSAYFGV